MNSWKTRRQCAEGSEEAKQAALNKRLREMGHVGCQLLTHNSFTDLDCALLNRGLNPKYKVYTDKDPKGRYGWSFSRATQAEEPLRIHSVHVSPGFDLKALEEKIATIQTTETVRVRAEREARQAQLAGQRFEPRPIYPID